MTRRSPWVVIVTFCSLLTVATSASALGAWVLWLDRTQISGGNTENEWTTVGVHLSKDDCEESLKDTVALQSRVDPPETAEKHGDNVISKKTDVGDIFLLYVCLPDTVDLRAPKGK